VVKQPSSKELGAQRTVLLLLEVLMLVLAIALSLCSSAAAAPRGDAMEALAAGHPLQAAAILEQALGGEDEDELRCLLARVHQLGGRPARAVAVLDPLPRDAGCVRRADWVLAEALLALGEEQAAGELVQQLGADALGAGRDRRTAERLVGLAERVLAEREPDVAQAARTLALALRLDLEEEQALGVARQLADLARDRDPGGDGAQAALPVLARAVGGDDDREDRLRLARLLGDDEARLLLAPLEEDLELLGERLALEDDLLSQVELVRGMARLAPAAELTRDARQRIGRRCIESHQVEEARELLEPVVEGFGDEAAEAGWLLLTLARDLGEHRQALALALDLLQRFPEHARRSQVEEAQVALQLSAARARAAAGDSQGAVKAYDAVVGLAPRDPRAGSAALEAAQVVGSVEEARRRRLELLSRWPGSEAATQALRALYLARALDGDDPQGAMEELHQRVERGVPGASRLEEQMRSPQLAVASLGRVATGEQGSVRVALRNIEQLELRLHRVDPVGWHRSGGQPWDLPEMDVGALAPDRSWTVQVPAAKPYQDRVLDLPLRVPEPGLYSVTVATEEREARCLLLVADTTVLAHNLGGELAVAVLRDGRPAADARVLLQGGDEHREGRTDASGLYRTRWQEPGEISVLALSAGGPALLVLGGAVEPDPQPAGQVVDVDRAVYRPGDSLGFRISSWGHPPGEWRLWLADTQGIGRPVVRRFQAGPDDSVVGELQLSAGATGAEGLAALDRWARLVALPPGGASEITLATVRVADELPEGRALALEVEERLATARLVEESGEPAVGVPLEWSWREGGRSGTLRTDAAGIALLEGPPLGVPWTLRVSVAGTDLRAERARRTAGSTGFELDKHRVVLRPGEELPLRLRGQGAARLRLVRVTELLEVEAPPDPWDPLLPFHFEGPETIPSCDPSSPERLHTLWLRERVVDEQAELRLEGAPEGRYRLYVDAPGLPAATLDIQVSPDAPRLLPAPPVGTGQSLRLEVEGEPALVGLESSEALELALLRPGVPLEVPVDARWGSRLGLVALGASGWVQRATLPVDQRLDLELEVQAEALRWKLRLRVSDAAGQGVPAQVVLRAVDTLLERQVGRAPGLAAGPLAPGIERSGAGAMALDLVHGASARLVARALLEEVARQEEARRALAARRGELEDNAVVAVLGEGVPIGELGHSMGMGGLGSRGYGSGGGGFGGDAIVLGSMGRRAARRPLQGERQRVLWQVLEADEQGVIELDLPAPLRGGTWRVEALAVAGRVAGAATELVHSQELRRAPTEAPAPSGLVSLALQPDPLAARDPGRAVTAARCALAALPAATAEERPALLAQVERMLGALRPDPAAYGSVGDAARALALLAELEGALELRGHVAQEFSDRLRQELAERDERLALVFGRARAGLPVDDASVARLLRELEELDDEQRSQLARALLAMGREDEGRAVVSGDGPQAKLARWELASERRRRRLQLGELGAPPALGDPSRPAWIAAVAVGASPGGWQPAERAPVEERPRAWRLPRSADGLPLRASLSGDRPGCGEEPCRLQPGDALVVRADMERVLLPAGLDWWPDPRSGRRLLRAVSSGSYRLEGLVVEDRPAALLVQVDGDEPSPLGPGVSLELARQAAAMGEDPSPLLSGRALDDWLPYRRRAVARLRFDYAVAASAPAERVVASFEDLRDLAPEESLSLEEVAAVARAYGRLRPERAVDIWRVGLDAAFAHEAAVASQVGPLLGPLAQVQVLQEVAWQYPELPSVEAVLAQQPARLLDIADRDELPLEVQVADVTRTDLRLMAAAWDREFVALHPDSEHRPSCGLRLVVGLLELDAPAQAETWAARLAREHAEHPSVDRFLYLRGLAAGAQGQRRQARADLRKVARGSFLQEDGTKEPSSLRGQSELALARIAEAGGQREEALERYEQVAQQSAAARASLRSLEARSLGSDSLLLLEPGQAASWPLSVAGVQQVDLRAWKLDLKTLFLRDGGLSEVHQLRVSGVSPSSARRLRLRRQSLSRQLEARLPLQGSGAWLVQVLAGGMEESVLVVRSELRLLVTDEGGLRRVTVLRRGRPAPGVQLRAWAGGEVVAARTDLRGVAFVPSFAPVLAFEGESYAFSDLEESGQAGPGGAVADELLAPLQQELRAQRDLDPGGGVPAGRM